MELIDIILYLLVGTFAGIVAGMLGVGGGLIIVPVLELVFLRQGISADISVHLAIGTSLATIVITSLSSIRAHQQRGAVLWPVVVQMTPGIIIGGLVGASLADMLESDPLKVIFGIFELLVAAKMAMELKVVPHRTLPGAMGLFSVGGVIGTVSAVMGIGGGSMNVPLLNWCNVDMPKAVATSSACGLPIALAGACGFIYTGWGEPLLPQWSSGYLYWPAFIGIVLCSALTAPFGAMLAHRLPAKRLRRIFSALLLLLGLRMLLL